ncbi:MAG: alpha/beta hydrolase [Myxococcales bacterium]|nr:MAG: alpha/beta hydrolase [Myxococcales bacterium]
MFGHDVAAKLLGWQRTFIFPKHLAPAKEQRPDPGYDVERWYREEGQLSVEAWFAPCHHRAEEKLPLVVFAHGNAELIDQWLEPLDWYRNNGFHLFLPEYRGYGRSTGKATEANILSDMVYFLEKLKKDPRIDASRILFHGRSLGGGVVCALAEVVPPAAMVVQSTFTSIPNVVRKFLVPSWLVLDRFDNQTRLESLDLPVLIVHGTKDKLIPFSHAQRLKRCVKKGKLIAYDADHNDCPPNWQEFWVELAAFVADNVSSKG